MNCFRQTRTVFVSIAVALCGYIITRLNEPSAVSLSAYNRPSKEWKVDSSCFTQGLVPYDEDSYVVSCGGFGQSYVGLLSGFRDGTVSSKVVFRAPKEYFLEGCAITKPDRLVVLTWRNGKILEFSLPDFRLIRQLPFPHEGWGLTYDGDRNELIATDGSAKLLFIDPSSLQTTRTCNARLSHDGITHISVRYMNELEYMNGLVFANIYIPASAKDSTNFIVGINPVSCDVEQIIPFDLNAGTRGNPEHVMNGIAKWGNSTNQFLVTGKNWNKIFLVETTPEQSPTTSKHNITEYLAQNLFFR